MSLISSVTDKDLLSEVSKRLSRKAGISRTKSDPIDNTIYNQFVKRTKSRLSWFKYIAKADPDSILENSLLPKYFDDIAKKCVLVEKNPDKFLNNVDNLHYFIEEGRDIPSTKETIVQLEFNKNKPIALALLKQSVNYVNEAFTGKFNNEPAFDTASTLIIDAKDVLLLAQAVYSGNVEEMSKRRYLDTVIREGFTRKVWLWLDNYVP